MKDKRHTGFSMVETVIYVALLAALAGVSTHSLLVMMRSYAEARMSRNLADGASLAMERMTREIRQASSVDALSSVLGSHPGRLTLDTRDAAGDPATVAFDGSDGSLTVDADSSASLLPPYLEVETLVFEATTTAASTEAVRIELRLRDVRRSGPEASFYSTVVLRGSH